MENREKVYFATKIRCTTTLWRTAKSVTTLQNQSCWSSAQCINSMPTCSAFHDICASTDDVAVIVTMECSKLRWSTEEMDLQRFEKKYSRSLPLLLLTTCGYMDVDNINEVSTDQVVINIHV